jgi:hypothetical protein
MKKIPVFLVLFFVFTTRIFSVNPCFPNGITFSSQFDIEIYQEINPNCTEIMGDVLIEGNDIQNLQGISIITAINGSLIIRNCPALTSTAGLLSLTTIGGSFQFINNDAKVNLFGFGGLTNIGADLIIQDNNMLTTLKGGTVFAFTFPGLQNVTNISGDIFIDSNAALTDLDGLADVISIDGDIHISNNTVLANIEGLSGISENVHAVKIVQNNALSTLMGLQNINAITGQLRIENNPLLTDFDGLDGINSIGDLFVWYNPALQSLEGLSNLEFDAGVLSIQGNNVLHDLNGLNHLTAVGSIIIYNNPGLEEITDLSDLTTIDGGIFFESNNALSSLQGINNIDHTQITDLTLTNNTQLSICDVESICNYLDNEGPAYITGNATGCASIEQVDQSCSAPYCPQLISPQDGETDVNPFTTLNWTTDDYAHGYIISIGTTPYGTELVDNEDVGYTTSYQYAGGFPCSSNIHVRILGYNDHGQSLDCSEAVFMTENIFIQLIAEVSICPGESVQLVPTTNGTFISWSPTEGLDDPFSFTPIASPESSTTYVASVSGPSIVCTALSFVDVIVNQEVDIDLYNFTGVICPDECTGVIGALGAGGVPPYEYLWNTGESGEKLFDVCAGAYSVSVTDSEGCSDEQEIIVYEYPGIQIGVDEIVHVTDSTMGSISLNIYYSTSPYTATIEDPFHWTGVDFEYSSNESDIDNLSPGCYRLVTFGGTEICSIDTVFCVEDHTTGLFEQDNSGNELKIYPNPASSKLFVEILSETTVEPSMVLYGLSGRELKAFDLMDIKNVIDISGYAPGLYFIKVITGKKQYHKKLLFL